MRAIIAARTKHPSRNAAFFKSRYLKKRVRGRARAKCMFDFGNSPASRRPLPPSPPRPRQTPFHGTTSRETSTAVRCSIGSGPPPPAPRRPPPAAVRPVDGRLTVRPPPPTPPARGSASRRPAPRSLACQAALAAGTPSPSRVWLCRVCSITSD